MGRTRDLLIVEAEKAMSQQKLFSEYTVREMAGYNLLMGRTSKGMLGDDALGAPRYWKEVQYRMQRAEEEEK